MVRVAINGFGRVGRAYFRLAHGNPSIKIVAINDLASIENLAYLLKYDSVHGRFGADITTTTNSILVNGHSTHVYNGIPSLRAWKKLNIDLVIEATGSIRSYNKASFLHLWRGAKKVLITANPRNAGNKTIPAYVYGVNDQEYLGERIISAASCSTNCAAPVLRCLLDRFDIKSVNLTAIHAYTKNQTLLDSGHKTDMRRGRAAALNIVPSASDAAEKVAHIIPVLRDRIMGSTVRVPVADGSLMVMAVKINSKTTVQEVNELLRYAATDTYKGIIEYSTSMLVSRDTVNNTSSAIIDSLATGVLSSSLINILAWYDHEWGYAARLIDLTNGIHAGTR